MSQTIPTTINNRQKINNPPAETAADYLLTHNAITKETGSISKTVLFRPLQKQIDEITNPDGFLKIGNVNQVGNTVSILALQFEWKIKPVLFFTNEFYSTVIAPATNGYNRIDVIVANDFGGFTKIQGNESITAAIQPNRPNNSLPVTFITVFGAAIVAIAPPTQPVLTLEAIRGTVNDLVKLKEDKINKGVANGYAPLNEFTKIASEYLNIVNDFVTGGATSLASAETVKTLKNQINAINLLLTSDNVNLDSVQELVDAIENVQISLSTILVNDLTTGGTTKAATAETVKVLKGLLDALTTVVGNKVDKVAGERLINAGEITKLAGLGSIATTVKPILSTALATQNVAGFVTYINALNPVVVVGASEIVKYNLTDTGRVFELLLRDRSFGFGQPAIVAANVLEVTEFLNKDIRLSNYPSTRNDGQLPTNKVLGTDANGNLKMYTIATAPAPYLNELVPDSYLPSNTGNFILKGSFFTPTMTIVLQGQTINTKTFISDNEIRLGVTTGATEGNFSITLDNGISVTFPNAILIILGTVIKPTLASWTGKTGSILLQNEGVDLEIAYATGSAIWNQELDVTKNFEIRYTPRESPLVPALMQGGANGTNGSVPNYNMIEIRSVLDNSLLWRIRNFANRYGMLFQGNGVDTYALFGTPSVTMDKEVKIRYIAGIWYFYFNGVLQISSSYAGSLTSNIKLTFGVGGIDISKIKYVLLN